MKSDDDYLIEMRERLAAFAASKLTLKRVEARDFRLVDFTFYDRVAARLAACGWVQVGDFVPVLGIPSDGNMRCFIRAFLSSDRSHCAACYHPRPSLWIRLLARIMSAKLGKVVEVETEFSDDTWIMTTTAQKAFLFDAPPLLILRKHLPEQTPVEDILEFHKKRVRAYLDTNPGVVIRKIHDAAGIERAQARQHEIIAVYRTMVGGMTAEEIERLSLFGKSRSAELKARMDELGGN